MKPLQWVAMGLVICVLEARFGSYDALPDPIGWLLVLGGLLALTRRTDVGFRLGLGYLGVLALVIATVTWFPAVQDALDDADPELVWSLDVPALAFQALLCHALAGLAVGASERTAATWFRLASLGLAVALVVPLLYQAGWEWLAPAGDLGLIVPLVLIGLLFWYSGREWTGAEQHLPRSVRRATEPRGD
ncbi:hypothetical protein FXB39_02535 [Nocardioides sp. BGMRC 2183]|nr:hypothetical protein FXB39_02535 [Nocardioides sp. BGMRC 2183]